MDVTKVIIQYLLIFLFLILQVNNLREIQALRRLSPHEHIISLEEVLYDQPTGRLALVFELMDANLYELIRGELSDAI